MAETMVVDSKRGDRHGAIVLAVRHIGWQWRAPVGWGGFQEWPRRIGLDDSH